MRINKSDNQTVKPVASATKTNSSKYATAQKHIKAAIDALGADAHQDVLAKESIANLSVVLMDLM